MPIVTLDFGSGTAHSIKFNDGGLSVNSKIPNVDRYGWTAAGHNV
jgi:hypothetical protein